MEKDFLMQKLIYLLFLLTFSALAQDSSKVIYGTDDREDVVNTVDNLMIEKSRSTAGMFANTSLSALSNGDYRVIGKKLTERGWCSSERFSNQITSPVCTGFLIAPDVIATAGHCVSKSTDCKNYSWAFDYKIPSSTATTAIIPKSSVYRCKSIIATVNSSTTKDDYAIIRLDRKVLDRSPLEIRRTGKIIERAPLVLIGHPKGLPLKIAPGANVRSNTATKYFVANLDSYGGNSGSPVFDALTGVVEGILVRGEADYVTTSAGCYISKVCSDTGCRGEDVTRITNLPLVQ
jgi:V8-like Glu-specific endopeptidase